MALLLGDADASDLRRTEDRIGDLVVVEGLLVAVVEGVPDEFRLPIGDVLEHRPADGVAEGPDVGLPGLVELVHLDVAPLVRRHSRLLSLEQVGVPPVPRGDRSIFALYGPLALLLLQ